MNKRIAVLMISLCMLLGGCAGPSEETEEPAATFVPAPVTAVTKRDEEPDDHVEQTETQVSLDEMKRDPAYDFNIDEMLPSDFGDFFTQEYECGTDSYTLVTIGGTSSEVTVLTGAEEGPTVYVVAGVHGDEEAAWQTGKLLEKISIRAGKLYVLAPANPWGIQKVPKSRFVNGKDMNRSFPGNAQGNDAQRAAYAIYSDISAVKPDFVFDLHEATIVSSDRDYLGSSLIYSNLELFGDMFLELILATQSGDICSEPFDYYGPGPEGSLNRTVTENLSIPVMTVETFRGYQMEDRLSDQLDIIQYVLRYYGMID